MERSTKDAVATGLGFVAAAVASVWAIWFVWTTWGAVAGIVSIFIVPETVGYIAYMVTALVLRALLALVPTKLSEAEQWAALPIRVAGEVVALPLLLNEPMRGPGRLSERTDGSWFLALYNGQTLRFEDPARLFAGYARQPDGSLVMEWKTPDFWTLQISAPAQAWLETSTVLGQLPDRTAAE